MKVNWKLASRLGRLELRGSSQSSVARPFWCRTFASQAWRYRQVAAEEGESKTRRAIEDIAGISSAFKADRGFEGAKAVSSAKAYNKRLSVLIDGQMVSFDHFFLRDACDCAQCIDGSTRQKLFQSADIPSGITVSSMSHGADGSIRLRWSNDVPGYGSEHETTLSQGFLRTYSRPKNLLRMRYNDQRQILWDRDIMASEVRSLDFEQYMKDDDTLLEALQQLSLYGLVFVKNVPKETSSVAEIGRRIGPLRQTFYGETWDVRSVAAAKNVAYTSQYLGLHMDLLYFADPPTLQLLHCMENSAEGGASLFADSFHAVAHVRLASPTLYSSLRRFPVSYHYHNDGHHYHALHPTVETSPHAYYAAGADASAGTPAHLAQPIVAVNYSPPFQAAFEASTGAEDHGARIRQYHAAVRALAARLQAPGAIYERRMAAGECVLFHNRRVLHGRRAFDLSASGGGTRWLRGAYLDGDCFASRRRVLLAARAARREEEERVARRALRREMRGIEGVGGDEHI